MNLEEELKDLGVSIIEGSGNQNFFNSMTYQDWSNYLPQLDLGEFLKTLASGIPNGLEKVISLQFFGGDFNALHLETYGYDKNQDKQSRIFNPAFVAVRYLNIDAKELKLVEINNNHSAGNGDARRHFISLLKAFENLPLEKLLLQATRVGSYVWAKCGFVPEPVEWEHLKVHIKDKVLPSIKEHISDEVLNLIEATLKSNNPKAIWVLADVAVEIKLPSMAGVTTTVGKALLVGSTWQGVLDKKDKTCTERLNSYLHNSPRNWVSKEELRAREKLYFGKEQM